MQGNHAYLIFKVVTSLIAGAYGIYATVTDFREVRDGRQVLSKWGKLGIGVLLISIALGIGADAWKEINDSKASADVSEKLQGIANGLGDTGKALQKTSDDLQKSLNITNDKLGQAQSSLNDSSAQISKNVALSKSVLGETQRAVDPIEHEWVLLGAELDVPAQEPFASPYIDRIERECHTDRSDSASLGFFNASSSFPDPGRPDEKALADLAHLKKMEITFRRNAKEDVGLTLDINCDLGQDSTEKPVEHKDCDSPEEYDDTFRLGNHVMYDRHLKMGGGEYHRYLKITCRSRDVRATDTPLIRSYSDFSGSIVRVEMSPPEPKEGDVSTVDPVIPFDISEVDLMTKTGSRFCDLGDFEKFKRVDCNPGGFEPPPGTYCFTGSAPKVCWGYYKPH